MSKPFSLQSPEHIAEKYGGNKQMIAHAAQMGMVDPTAAVLAGMFIDRMRSAQMAEGAQQPTVAQQVLSPQPAPQPQQQAMPAPPAPPSGPPPGMGAMMPGAPPPQNDQQQAPLAGGPPPQGPGMAEGGLTTLPVDDAMFDEPDNGGYGGGGLVAFAAGGGLFDEDFYHRQEMQESGGNQNAISPAGARGVMQLMPGTMRDPGYGVAPLRDNSEAENRRLGRDYQDALSRKYGSPIYGLMAFNWGPGNFEKWLRAGKPASMIPAETRNYVKRITGTDIGGGSGAAAGGPKGWERLASDYKSPDFADQLMPMTKANMGMLKDLAPTEHAARDHQVKYANKDLDPETQDKNRKRDMWEALAQMGFGMASSKSPYFLQAVGEAAQAALPGMQAARKTRDAERDRDIKTLADAEGISNNEARQRLSDALGISKEQLEHREKAAERDKDIEQSNIMGDTRLGVAEIRGPSGGAGEAGGIKPLTESQKTQRVRSAITSANAAMKVAKTELNKAKTSGDWSSVESALKQYRMAQSAYEELAPAMQGAPPFPQIDWQDYADYGRYVTSQGHLADGRPAPITMANRAARHGAPANYVQQPSVSKGIGVGNKLEDPLGIR